MVVVTLRTLVLARFKYAVGFKLALYTKALITIRYTPNEEQYEARKNNKTAMPHQTWQFLYLAVLSNLKRRLRNYKRMYRKTRQLAIHLRKTRNPNLNRYFGINLDNS